MVRSTRFRLTGGILAGVATAALPFSAAIGEEVPPIPVMNVEIVDTAALGARGAVAFVTVQVTCFPGGDFAFVGVHLTQRSGSGIAEGFGDDDVSCDGELHEVTLPVTASGRAFKKGVAFASAFGEMCDLESCVTGDDAEEIQLVRA